MDNRKKLILAGLGFLVLVLFMIGLAFRANKTNLQTETSTRVDPISGEIIVDVDGKTPEKATGSNQPSIIGSDAVYPLFSDEEVFGRIKDIALLPTYKDHSLIRISKDSVTKKVTTAHGVTTIDVFFQVYLDKDDSKKDTFTTSFNQDSGTISIVIEGDYTPKTPIETSIRGDL